MSSKTVDENYRRLRAELDELLSKDKRLTAIADKISKGTADFSDTARYTQIVSKHMSDVIKHNIGELKQPMAKEMVCKELLRDHYELINGVFGEVQVSVDEKLGIHLNPIKPAYPAERVDSWAHSLEDPTVEPSVTERRAASGSENIGNSIHDDCVKENAKVREQAGLDCYLTRDAGGGCCPWCQALEGRYSYADAPDDIFRRHDNCTCTVTYECGRKRQQVWSKQDWSNNKEREYLKRLDAEKAAKRKALSDNSKPKVNTKEQAIELEKKLLDKSQESGIIDTTLKMSASIQQPPDFSKYAVKEDHETVERVKNTIIEKLGIPKSDVDLTGIKNADVLEPFVNQLVRIQKETEMRFPAIAATEIIDGDPCCIAGFKPFENRLYISSRFFNSKEALLDTMKDWVQKGVLPKQAKTIRYIAEHEAAHIRIPEKYITSDEAKAIWKKRNLLNDNDGRINEYYADAVAIFRTNRNTQDNNIIAAIAYLRKGGVKI